ncbi:lipoxygenase [Xylariaceae sp. FL0255]|nr:lipoxygenase [Xylariaceae sp. FL0255]
MALVEPSKDEAINPTAPAFPTFPGPGFARTRPEHNDLLTHPDRSKFFNSIEENPAKLPLQRFDPGVFNQELFDEKLYSVFPKKATYGMIGTVLPRSVWAGGQVKAGTYQGTQAAISEIYERMESAYTSYLGAAFGIDLPLPRKSDLDDQKKNYQWSSYPLDEEGNPAEYPPHLQHIPKEEDVHIWEIFDKYGLVDAKTIIAKIIPGRFKLVDEAAEELLHGARYVAGGSPQVGKTIQEVVDYNKHYTKQATDVSDGRNLAHLEDWFTDRRFSEQSFSGTNPTTIKQIPEPLLKEFIEAAKTTGEVDWAATLSSADKKSLLVQDYSYFRKAIQVGPTDTMKWEPVGVDMVPCWAVASVALYQLHDDGKLHPIAITIDYRVSLFSLLETMANSVTIFNKRKLPTDSSDGEHDDWPWRFAKTCALTSDWYRHELTVHLTDAHFIEEAIIVATNRTIPMDHTVHQILYPHWLKTLPLNAAARSILVPQVIRDIVGFTPEQTSSFVKSAFEEFDFVGNYVPNQLEVRGFPGTPEGLRNERYKNYPYAKNISEIWPVIKAYVKARLLAEFDGETQDKIDDKIKVDHYIADWCKEIQTAGWIKSFPTVQTLDQLIDVLTMCIHLAAPYHTAVNYLQNFYQYFVPSKPSALFCEPPSTLEALKSFGEPELVAALPLNRQRQWMLAAHIPWLLSFKVGQDNSLIHFAFSQYTLYRNKDGAKQKKVADAASGLYQSLIELKKKFFDVSAGMDADSIPYLVMDPHSTAVSVLI